MYDGSWLSDEFRRTGLPRSGLALYLGIDNAAVTRAAAGTRPLSAAEALRAEAYFSVVPKAVDAEFLKAVRRLRAPERRARANKGLASWLRAHAASGPASGLFATAARGEADLRADQIVALARSERLDLPALVNGDVRPDKRSIERSGPDAETSPSDRLAAAARRWAPREQATYEFERGALPARPVRPAEPPRASDADIVVLRKAEVRHPMLERCTPYLVPDDSLSPRFEQGETLYLEPPGREIRRGDYTAVLLRIEGDRASAVVGRLRFETKDAVIVEPPRSGPREIARSEILDLRRVAFCAL